MPNRARTPSAIARATGSLTAPKLLEQFRRHAEFPVLHLVGVRHHAAAEEVARAGHEADAVRDQPAGDALGRRQRLLLLVQQPHDRVLQFLVLDAEDQFAEPLADGRFDRGDLGLRLGERAGPGEDAERDDRVADRDADLGNVPAARQVGDLRPRPPIRPSRTC